MPMKIGVSTRGFHLNLENNFLCGTQEGGGGGSNEGTERKKESEREINGEGERVRKFFLSKYSKYS